MGNEPGGEFDGEREMMMMMLDQGRIPTGNGGFVEISEEAADAVKAEIEAGASFSSEVDEIQYETPEGP